MQPIAFCNRCRGMKVGWNARYILHCLACQEWLSKSSKLLILTVLLTAFVLAFPLSTGVAVTDAAAPDQPLNAAAATEETPDLFGPEVQTAIEKMLLKYGIEEALLPRVSQAVLDSSAKYDVDPRLVTSIMIVESRGQPFAVSDKDSVGIMQIHLHTWGEIADNENINLFKIEDNVDFGVRILKDYIVGSGLWEGVARYKGRSNTPESWLAADEYVRKVQRVYGLKVAEPAD